MIQRKVHTVFMLLCAWSAAACSLSGYNDLGSEFDIIEAIGTEDAESWLRVDAEGTAELLTLGGIPEGEETGGFSVYRVTSDNSCDHLVGEYRVADDTLSLTSRYHFSRPNEFDKPPSGRTGSQRTVFDPPETDTLTAARADDVLVLVQGENESIYHRLDALVAALDPALEEDALLLLRLFNVSAWSLQTRIPAFGGTGMMQYLGKTTTFTGILSGQADMSLASAFSPKTTTVFNDYTDINGIVLAAGDQISATDMGGTGTLTGTIDFVFEEEDVYRIDGSVEYDIRLVQGASADGNYIITTNGNTWSVPFDIGEEIDLTGLFPTP